MYVCGQTFISLYGICSLYNAGLTPSVQFVIHNYLCDTFVILFCYKYKE